MCSRFDENLAPIEKGHIPLRDAFFAPETLLSAGGVDPYLRGLFATPIKKPLPNELLNDELTENLFNKAHEVRKTLIILKCNISLKGSLSGG